MGHGTHSIATCTSNVAPPYVIRSDECFDFTERCRSGKRPAFGFVQSNPFIDRFAKFGINCAFVAAVYAA